MERLVRAVEAAPDRRLIQEEALRVLEFDAEGIQLNLVGIGGVVARRLRPIRLLEEVEADHELRDGVARESGVDGRVHRLRDLLEQVGARLDAMHPDRVQGALVTALEAPALQLGGVVAHLLPTLGITLLLGELVEARLLGRPLLGLIGGQPENLLGTGTDQIGIIHDLPLLFSWSDPEPHVDGATAGPASAALVRDDSAAVPAGVVLRDDPGTRAPGPRGDGWLRLAPPLMNGRCFECAESTDHEPV